MKTQIIPIVVILSGILILVDGIVRVPQLVAVGFLILLIGILLLIKQLKK